MLRVIGGHAIANYLGSRVILMKHFSKCQKRFFTIGNIRCIIYNKLFLFNFEPSKECTNLITLQQCFFPFFCFGIRLISYLQKLGTGISYTKQLKNSEKLQFKFFFIRRKYILPCFIRVSTLLKLNFVRVQ